MKAELITIGDEILIGQIIDTNSAWLGQKLNEYGIDVYQITSVHDNKDHIKKALDNAKEKVDLVIVTGGLGPTKDDITKVVLAEYFETEMVFNDNVFEHITELLSSRGVTVNSMNRNQALLPANCKILFNPVGTAAGMWFEQNETIFISLPGVPYEMEAIMTEEVFPRLLELRILPKIVHKTILTFGLAESMLAEKIEEWESALPSFIKLAYLPNPNMVRLRLSAYGNDKASLESEISKHIDLLHLIIPNNIFGYDEENLASVVGDLLKRISATLSVAESCTGGNIAHVITSNAGSSDYFKGGLVAYSNEIKTSILGVPSEIISKHGAVSREVAEIMAINVREKFKTDYSIATTGVAGPGGGTEKKPVGTVWIAISGKEGIISQEYIFKHNRERNIIRSTQTSLNMIRIFILNNKTKN